MKLGISSYTYPWAAGLPDARPNHPLTPLQLLEKADDLGVGIVQFGPNMPVQQLSEKDLGEVVKRAEASRIDVEIATNSIDPQRLKAQINFAKRIGAILLKTTPERAGGRLPMRAELLDCLRSIESDLAEEKVRLAIDNSRIPAAELNEVLGSIRSPWLGVALDTVNPLALPHGWQMSVRVLGHRTLSLHIKDFVVLPEAHGMGFSVQGCPVGKGQLNVPWLVESFAALRIVPSALLECWTPQQNTLEETIALEAAWAKQGVDYLRHFITD